MGGLNRYTSTALHNRRREWAAVECRGQGQTKSGKPYNNQYCWVCRVQDGRLTEVVEYMDTHLVATALER